MTAFFECQKFLALACAEFCSRQAHRIPEQESAYDEAEEDKSPWCKQGSWRNRAQAKVAGNDQDNAGNNQTSPEPQPRWKHECGEESAADRSRGVETDQRSEH